MASQTPINRQSHPSKAANIMLYLSLLLTPTTSLPTNPLAPLINPPSTLSTQQTLASWVFDGYSASQSCVAWGYQHGDKGNTHRQANGNKRCVNMDDRGVTVYSFDGSAMFRLCLYSEKGCGGGAFEEVREGEEVWCQVPERQPLSFKVNYRWDDC